MSAGSYAAFSQAESALLMMEQELQSGNDAVYLRLHPAGGGTWHYHVHGISENTIAMLLLLSAADQRLFDLLTVVTREEPRETR